MPSAQDLEPEGKKNLRLVNKAIYCTITEVDKTLKCAYKNDSISPAQLRQLADDCPALIGLECTLSPKELEGLAGAMNYLHKKHPSMEKVEITLAGTDSSALDLEHVSNGCPILTGMNGEFDDDMSSPEYEQNDAVAAMVRKHPELECLKFNRFNRVNDAGSLSLFQLKHLKVLHLSSVQITGENIQPSDVRGTALPCLEELNLSNCIRITDSGLTNILSMCGGRLKELDLSWTDGPIYLVKR